MKILNIGSFRKIEIKFKSFVFVSMTGRNMLEAFCKTGRVFATQTQFQHTQTVS